MKKKGSGGCGCLGVPMRALSRAGNSACDLYVRGLSRCVRGLPSGSSAGVVGRGFVGSSGAASLRLRVSSDKADDLLRAAAAASSRRQRRVAAEPAEPVLTTTESVGYGAGKMVGSAGGQVVGQPALGVRPPSRKRAVVPTMGTIAEDAPCEFRADGGVCTASSMKPPRRGVLGGVTAGASTMSLHADPSMGPQLGGWRPASAELVISCAIAPLDV